MPKTKKTCSVQYYPKAKNVRVKALSTNFYPMYVKYMFEYLKIPLNVKITFNDRTIEGGIEAWLKE